MGKSIMNIYKWPFSSSQTVNVYQAGYPPEIKLALQIYPTIVFQRPTPSISGPRGVADRFHMISP